MREEKTSKHSSALKGPLSDGETARTQVTVTQWQVSQRSHTMLQKDKDGQLCKCVPRIEK